MLYFSLSLFLLTVTFSLALFLHNLSFCRRREREREIGDTDTDERRNAREATAATTSCWAERGREQGGIKGGEGGGIRERSSHKQLVASAKLPRLLRRRTDSSSTVCGGYTHLSDRMGLGGRKVCVECERLPRESEKRARQWISTTFSSDNPLVSRVAPPFFDSDFGGFGCSWRHRWDDVTL